MEHLPRGALIRAIRRHPALLQYARKIGPSGRTPRVQTAGDVLGERLAFALMFLERPASAYATGPGLGAVRPAFLEAAARSILRAVPVLWRSELVLAVQESRLPPHVVDGVDAPFPFISSRRRGDPWLQPWGGAPPPLLSQNVLPDEHAANHPPQVEPNSRAERRPPGDAVPARGVLQRRVRVWLGTPREERRPAAPRDVLPASEAFS